PRRSLLLVLILGGCAGIVDGAPPDEGAAPTVELGPAVRETGRLPVGIVTYTGSSGAAISYPVKRGADYAIDFIHRNSHAASEVLRTYVAVPGRAPFGSTAVEAWYQPADAIPERLIAEGHQPGQYYGLYFNGVGVVPRLGAP